MLCRLSIESRFRNIWELYELPLCGLVAESETLLQDDVEALSRLDEANILDNVVVLLPVSPGKCSHTTTIKLSVQTGSSVGQFRANCKHNR